MQPRTILIAVGGSLVLVLAVARPWRDGAVPAERAPLAGATRAAAPELPPRDGAVARVRAEVADLRAEVSRLGVAQPPEEALPPEEEQARYEQRVAAQTDALAKAFAADGRDPSWSPQTERALRDRFAAAPPAGARLEEVACGGRLCRLAVAFDSVRQREEGVDAVFGLIRWRSVFFGDAAPDDPRRYIVYAARDPESFPRVD